MLPLGVVSEQCRTCHATQRTTSNETRRHTHPTDHEGAPSFVYLQGSGPSGARAFGSLASEPKTTAGAVLFGSKAVYVPGPGMAGLSQTLVATRPPPPKRVEGATLDVSRRDGMPYFPGPGAMSRCFSTGLVERGPSTHRLLVWRILHTQ